MDNPHLSVGAFGDDVRELHEQLRRHGFTVPTSEVDRAFFGPATRAALHEFQRTNGLKPSAAVDAATRDALAGRGTRTGTAMPPPPRSAPAPITGAPTAARSGRAVRLEDVPEAERRLVRGHVLYQGGLLVEGVTVRAYDRDLRQETFLGEAETDREGRYEIPYAARQLSRPGKLYADLLLRVFDLRRETPVTGTEPEPDREPERPIAESAILFGAQPLEKIKLVVQGGIKHAWSEYEQLIDELKPYLGEVSLAELTENAEHQDITFLAGQANLDPHNIARAVWAQNRAEQTGLRPEVLYGFARQDLPLTLPELLAQSQASQKAALETAIFNHVIPGRTIDHVDSTLSQLRELVVGQAFEPPREEGRSSLGSLLATVLPEEKVQAQFLTEYVNHSGPMSDFWHGLQGKPEFQERVGDLQLTLQLGALTGNNLSLVQELQEVRQQGGFANLRDLTQYDADDWLTLMGTAARRGGAAVPPEIQGEDDEEKLKTYAATVTRMIADAFPTEVIAHRLQRDEAPERADLRTFFDNVLKTDTGFEIGQSSIGSFIANNPEILSNVADKDALEGQLKGVQRVFRLAPRYDEMQPLLDQGFDSARAVTRLAESTFVTQVADRLDPATARQVYARAEYVSAAALNMFATFSPDLNGTGMQVLPWTAADVEGAPDWQSLFGTLDLCACQHCRSVHGPAAYFVELLAWLNERKAKTANVSAKDVLFRRRPDLGDIELTCENTSITLPYIDLVNEVLEYAVAPFQAIELPAALTSDLESGELRPSVRAALLSRQIELGEPAVVVETRAGIAWFITDHTVLYSIQFGDGRLRIVARCPQTSGQTTELLANPRHVSRAAYDDVLSKAVFPLSLPFDFWGLVGRSFLTHLGVPRHELMRTFSPRGESSALSEQALAAEHLGLSTLEWQLITDSAESVSPTWTLWGLLQTGNEVPSLDDPGTLLGVSWIEALKRVRVLLDRARISYEDLTALLSTRFVDPTRSLAIVSMDPADPTTCDTTRLALTEHQPGTLEPALRRMVAFLRLWRALGWTIPEVDMIIGALQGSVTPSANRLGQTLLIQISHLKRLRELLDLPVERLLTFWAPIETRGTDPLYQRLFQNPTVLQPVDPDFRLTGNELAIVTSAPDAAKLSTHVPAILAALSISDQDLATLRAAVATDDALTLANLSGLFRAVVLAKCLRLRVGELLALMTLTGIDPFDPARTDQTIHFVETVDQIRASGFSPAELAYLLHHRVDETAPTGPNDETIGLTLDDIRTNLRKILAEHELEADPNGELTRKNLAMLGWAPSLIEQVVAGLKGTETYIAPLTELPKGIVFPEAVASRVSYDQSTKHLAFTGPMTTADRQALLSAAADPAYQATVATLFTLPRAMLTEALKAFELPAFSTYLAQLPDGIEFPAALRGRISFDPLAMEDGVIRPRLSFKGMMLASEREQLLDLATDQPAPDYRAAIAALYVMPRTYQPDAANAFLTAAAVERLFESARTADQRFQPVLRRLLPYLRDRLSANLVKQKLGDALRLEAQVADRLLSRQITVGDDTTKPVITVFLDPRFAHSNSAREVTRAAFPAQFQAFTRLHKIALLIERFQMSPLHLAWLDEYGPAAGWLDLNGLPLAPSTSADNFWAWHRLLQFLGLRDTLPGGEATLGELLALVRARISVPELLDRLSILTTWNRADLDTLAAHLQTSRGDALLPLNRIEAYLGEGAWLRLQACYRQLTRIGASAERCIAWTKADLTHQDATEILRAAKAKYDGAEWAEVARSVREPIRERQREALVAYLLAQPDPDPVRRLRWRDATDLYQYYLIDTEMSACMLTSRIVQAISSVQLFVQRCLLNLEPEIKADEVTDQRWRDWKWMKNYRVWEANRKIFLYPENWIEPDLRDDKSPFFKDLENDLLQDETTQESAEDAFLQYLEKLDVVARLEIVGMFHQQDDAGRTDTLHVFGRTRQTPHRHFYRQRLASGRWTAWQLVDLDIEGDHLIPVIWNRRLYLFWPIFVEQTKEDPDPAPQTAATQTIKQPQKHWQIQLAWSEYKRARWLPKQITTVSLASSAGPTPNDRESSRLRHIFYAIPDEQGLSVFCFHHYQVEQPYSYPYFAPIIRSGWKGGEFRFTGCGGEVHIREAWTRRMVTVRGTTPERMQFIEQGSIGLYLPKSLTTAEDGIVLRSTPGSIPFSILHPHQDAGLTGYRPFFYQDDIKTYLATPEEITIKTTTWKQPAAVSPAFIDQALVKYYVEPNLLVASSQMAMTTALASTPVMLVGGHRAAAPAALAVVERRRSARTGVGSLDDDQNLSIVSQEVGQILNPSWLYPSPVISVSRRERRYRFHSFYHPYQCLFVRRLNRDGLDGLFRRELQLTATDPFESRYRPTDLVTRFDAQGRPVLPRDDVDFSYTGAYSQYNWEVFFHAPLMIARKLSQNQQFEAAQRWFHYIFDPTDISPDEVPQKYWRTRPFYETSHAQYREQQILDIVKRLASDTPDPELERQVTEWRDNPFNPHLIARLRTTAYQKTVVMKYLDNLIAWADQLFRRDTLESVNEATQLYVMAADILGRRPTNIPPRANPLVQTFNSLDPKLSDFATQLVTAENFVVGPEPSSLPAPAADIDRPPLSWPPVPFFCVTPNDKLLSYWDTVADRLFKIRHCMNIEGLVRQLPLFEPPIDPALLIRATAAGIDLGSVLNEINAPLPAYRFNVMIQKAAELCGEVKSLGQALLSALEKRDAEALAQLRSSHEISVLTKVREIRQKQKDEAYASWESLNRARQVTEAKRDYFRDIEERIEEERQHLSNLQTAATLQTIGQGIEIVAGALALIPDFKVGIAGAFGSPQVGATFGGSKMSTAVQVASRGFALSAAIYNYMATRSSIEAGFKRRWSEWKNQENLANLELLQIDKQIEAADIRWQLADQELKHHDLQVENARSVDDFLRGKYTNRELYDWLIGQLSGLYFQSYQLAYDTAKRAERAYRYELGLDDSNFIRFGYWDSLKRGMLAGERLYQDIKRLELAHLDQNRREYEITKHVSVATLDPLALLRLRETGVCYVDLPESLFDVDFAGHYLRRLKSVSLTIPCVTGPYTGVQCTLTLLRNSVRSIGTLRAGKYARVTDVDDPRFRDSVGASQTIVTSTAQNDSGLFDLSFRDERYLPFEGAGAISSWRISLADEFRPFDYDTISEVILHLKYTAREGGDALREQVVDELSEAVNQMALAENRRGLYRWFSLKYEFPSEWHRFLSTADPATGDHIETFDLVRDRFPYLFRGRRLAISGVNVVALGKDGPLSPFDLYLTPSGAAESDDNDKVSLEPNPAAGNVLQKSKSYQGQEKEPGPGWQLRLKSADLGTLATTLNDVALVFQYSVGPRET